MPKLTQQKCVPCEGGIDPLTPKDREFSVYMNQVTDWNTLENDKKITKKFSFKNFKKALSFVNQVGEIAEKEGHHPDILLHSWNKVVITLYTHAIGGLSVNDFIVASKIDLII